MISLSVEDQEARDAQDLSNISAVDIPSVPASHKSKRSKKEEQQLPPLRNPRAPQRKEGACPGAVIATAVGAPAKAPFSPTPLNPDRPISPSAEPPDSFQEAQQKVNAEATP